MTIRRGAFLRHLAHSCKGMLGPGKNSEDYPTATGDATSLFEQINRLGDSCDRPGYVVDDKAKYQLSVAGGNLTLLPLPYIDVDRDNLRTERYLTSSV